MSVEDKSGTDKWKKIFGSVWHQRSLSCDKIIDPVPFFATKTMSNGTKSSDSAAIVWSYL